MATNIVILGTGGTCFDILDTLLDINDTPNPKQFGGPFHFLGFLDDNPPHSKIANKFAVLGSLKDAQSIKDAFFINGIGSPRSFLKKEKLIDSLGIDQNRFATIIHPTASVSRFSSLGPGSVIFQNATVTSNVSIGSHVVVLPHSVVSHDSTIGDYSCVAGGVCVSGNVTIGKSCYLGTNSSIRDGITIGDNSLVGMGANVISDIPPNSTFIGNPAQQK